MVEFDINEPFSKSDRVLNLNRFIIFWYELTDIWRISIKQQDNTTIKSNKRTVYGIILSSNTYEIGL